jgi:Family of unknown function (DUF6069)
MTTLTSSSIQQERVALGRLWWVTLLTIVAASAANLVVYLMAIALFEGPRNFALLTPVSIVVSIAVGVGAAAIAYALIGRFSKRPIRVFRIVAVVALVLSFASPISAAYVFPPSDAPDAITVGFLFAMHVVAAIITIGLFTTMARATGDE